MRTQTSPPFFFHPDFNPPVSSASSWSDNAALMSCNTNMQGGEGSMGRNVINSIKTEIYQSSAKHVRKISLVCLSSLPAAGVRAAAHAQRVGGMHGNIFTKERAGIFEP